MEKKNEPENVKKETLDNRGCVLLVANSLLDLARGVRLGEGTATLRLLESRGDLAEAIIRVRALDPTLDPLLAIFTVKG